MIYLLHLTVPLKRSNGTAAEHYLGHCEENGLEQRLEIHRKGHGAKMLRAAVERGSDLVLVRTWPNGSFALEHYLKNLGHLKQHCPICRSWHLRNRKEARRRAAAALNHQLELPSQRRPRGNGTVWLLPNTGPETSPPGTYRLGHTTTSTTRSGASTRGATPGGSASGATAQPVSTDATRSAGTEQRSGSEP